MRARCCAWLLLLNKLLSEISSEARDPYRYEGVAAHPFLVILLNHGGPLRRYRTDRVPSLRSGLQKTLTASLISGLS